MNTVAISMKNVLIKAFNNIFPIDLTVFQIIEPEKSNHLRFLEDSIIAIPGSPTPYRPIYPVDEKSSQHRHSTSIAIHAIYVGGSKPERGLLLCRG
jgi:hypothetical protein